MKALVLSGGGARGCFQVGALDYLIREKNLDFDIVCGVSVGALNGTMIAQGEMDNLKEIWLNIKSPKDIYRRRWDLIPRIGPTLAALLGKDSLYDNSPLWKLIEEHVDQDKIVESGRILRIGVVSLYTGKYYSIAQTHSSLKKLILASTAIPFTFSPVDVSADLRAMVDGGVRNITPLKEAIDLGADEIIVVLCSPLELPRTKPVYEKGLEIAFRTLEILTNEIYNNDIETCLNFNTRPDKRTIDLRIIRPEADPKMRTQVCETLDFRPDPIRRGMAIGYEQARLLDSRDACA
jgi:NTE family protein